MFHRLDCRVSAWVGLGQGSVRRQLGSQVQFRVMCMLVPLIAKWISVGEGGAAVLLAVKMEL